MKFSVFLFSLGQFARPFLGFMNPRSRLFSVVSVVWMSWLFFIDADRADPMPGKSERQGRSANICFFHEGAPQGHLVLLHVLA